MIKGDARLPARFWAKVEILESGCWQWTAALSSQGYGRIRLSNPRRIEPAHRYAYEMLVGPVDSDHVIDHICHQPDECTGGPTCAHRGCVNPSHLRPCRSGENTSRERSTNWIRVRDRCPKGHEYVPVHYGRTRRVCPTCETAWRAKRRAALKTKGAAAS